MAIAGLGDCMRAIRRQAMGLQRSQDRAPPARRIAGKPAPTSMVTPFSAILYRDVREFGLRQSIRRRVGGQSRASMKVAPDEP